MSRHRSSENTRECYEFGCHSQVDEGTPPEPEGSFVDYQTTMVKFSKAIAITAQEMVSVPSLSLPSRSLIQSNNSSFGDVNMSMLMSYVLSATDD